jgi:basic membrane protein A
VFAEEQGSFLVGAAAALKTENDHIGFIGGVETPLIQKFEAGYPGRGQAVKPDIRSTSVYLTQPPDFSASVTRPRARPRRRACTTTARTSSSTPPAVRRRRLPGGRLGRQGHRRGRRPVQHRRPAGEDGHHDLDAQERRRRGLRVPHQVNDGSSRRVDAIRLKVDGVGYSKSGGFVDDIEAKLEGYKKRSSTGTSRSRRLIAVRPRVQHR